MAQSPAVYHAMQERWSFFVTLTFAGVVPAPALAFALQRRWLDVVSRPLLHEIPESLLWLSREELGEQNGRLHFHVLIGEIRDASRINKRTCLALMSEWEKLTEKRLGNAGMARCRVFQPALDGVGYVLKGLESAGDWTLRGANTYEIGKFGGEFGRTVRLARCLLLRWGGKKGHKYSLQARERRDGHRVKCEL
jgi:hypothetical protein